MHVESQDAKIHTVCNVTHTPRKAMDIQVHDAPNTLMLNDKTISVFVAFV